MEFVSSHIHRIFSEEFTEAEGLGLATLAEQVPLLRSISSAVYVRERQHVVCRLFEIAWHRNVPNAVFLQSGTIIANDARVRAIRTDVYSRALSKAQAAQLPTFVYIASVFIAQLFPQGAERPADQVAQLFDVFSKELTGRYVAFETLVKQHKFEL